MSHQDQEKDKLLVETIKWLEGDPRIKCPHGVLAYECDWCCSKIEIKPDTAATIVGAMLHRAAITGEHSGKWGSNAQVEDAMQAILALRPKRVWAVENSKRMCMAVHAIEESADLDAGMRNKSALHESYVVVAWQVENWLELKP